ncbi:MAG: hypothetical protein HYT79_02980 [Elusimicrobia bacterium]|nr:hypothetical protein [Elusimicrobiota bacterium]
MKYMQNGGFQHNPHMRLTLLLTCLLLAGLWVTNGLLYFSRMGLTPQSVVNYYLGSEANFTLPRTYQSMLEVTHMHLPMMALVILLVTHLLIFAPFSDRAKKVFISGTFLAAFLGEASGWLVRFVNPVFAWLKIVSFVTLECLFGFLLAALILFLMKSSVRRHPRT